MKSKEVFTLKEVFPDWDNKRRANVGRLVKESYRILTGKEARNQVKEKNAKGYEYNAMSYPVFMGDKNDFSFLDYIKTKFGC